MKLKLSITYHSLAFYFTASQVFVKASLLSFVHNRGRDYCVPTLMQHSVVPH